MATFLYRLGRLAFRRRRLVVLGWLAILGVAGLGSSFAGPLPEDSGSAPGIEASAALDLVHARFPDAAIDPGLATARVVFVAPPGARVIDRRAVLDRLVTDVADGRQVSAVVGPFQAWCAAGQPA